MRNIKNVLNHLIKCGEFFSFIILYEAEAGQENMETKG